MGIWLIEWGLIILASWTGLPGGSTPRPLTFEDLVRAQEAVERVYYNHRIWPKENPGPKPPFEQMISKAQIEAKVEDYLKKSAALDEFWRRPIQPEQLQAEMDRMAKQTQDPETLKELFAALDNNPYLIAECLAQPVLADRLIRNWYAYDARFHKEAREKAEKAFRELTPRNFSMLLLGSYNRAMYMLDSRYDVGSARALYGQDESRIIRVNEDQLARMKDRFDNLNDFLSFRESTEGFIIERPIFMNQDSIEVESQFVPKQDLDVWLSLQEQFSGLWYRNQSDLSYVFSLPVPTPAQRSSSTGNWVQCSLINALDARGYHATVWTGTEMIVWGGNGSNSGNRYDPSLDIWTRTSTGSNCPMGRSWPTAVWTGQEMIVWGGGDDYFLSPSATNTGGRYDPQTDSWLPTSTAANCPIPRYRHSAVWTGSEMIVWGGADSSGCLNMGGRYSPSSDQWVQTATIGNCPSARKNHTVIWTGEVMIIWGGTDYSAELRSGGRYDPSTDSWQSTSLAQNCPTERADHTAVWTGTEMIIWGGSLKNSGARYNPSTDHWTATSTNGSCPEGRSSHTAVWTGDAMIIWGGLNWNPEVVWALNTGGKYDPVADKWSFVSTGSGCPSARAFHSAVWTGSEMIIWGGGANSGGRYNPNTRTWVNTSRGNETLDARSYFSSVWTGNEMIIWGGYVLDYPSVSSSGGKYIPSLDAWIPTSRLYCPEARSRHSAIWTGEEMIIWGGVDADSHWALVGGRYAPGPDTWTAVSDGENCPSGRYYHTAVWTGTEMIIWGGNWATNTGARYSPSSDTWDPTSVGNHCPSGRNWHTAIWTGQEMIVWVGYTSTSPFDTDSGGRYNPLTDSWLPTSVGTDCPQAREHHTAVWTGTEMIVWGGSGYDQAGSYRLSSGGQYDPSADSWRATAEDLSCPSPRLYHSAVWTGMEMIIWGGLSNTGGRYDPQTDMWSATSTGEYCPSARSYHASLWTGDAMIIWGGSSLASGGIYRPYSSHERPLEKP